MIDHQTQEELRQCILKMREASSHFYAAAVRCDNHAFIEFTGLMNEYIAVCKDRMREGIDFRFVNKHTGSPPLLPVRLEYLNEKIDCIYGVEFVPKGNGDGSL